MQLLIRNQLMRSLLFVVAFWFALIDYFALLGSELERNVFADAAGNGNCSVFI
jgi:hypothetical protein